MATTYFEIDPFLKFVLQQCPFNIQDCLIAVELETRFIQKAESISNIRCNEQVDAADAKLIAPRDTGAGPTRFVPGRTVFCMAKAAEEFRHVSARDDAPLSNFASPGAANDGARASARRRCVRSTRQIPDLPTTRSPRPVQSAVPA